MNGAGIPRNLPLFIAYRVFFHARFYYPVIGVLFIDLGITLEQYALLNLVWAVAILLIEIPSGALADAIGRRAMVVLSAGLMVCEMALLALAPTGNPTLLFVFLLLNRIVSGVAEACGSGADEALAYDSLPETDRDAAWARVLESLMRWKSAAFLAAMLVGAALFDRDLHVRVAEFFGRTGDWPVTTRWPVLATLATSLACLAAACLMREPGRDGGRASAASVRELWANVARGARHVFTVRRVAALLLVALLLDSFIRLFLTFASNYYRLIELPAFSNGILGAGLALLGFVVAPAAKRMVAGRSAGSNFGWLVALVAAGLGGLAFAVPVWGVWVLLPLGLAMSGLQFFTSFYLNRWTTPDVRATVLSFRGVAFNLGYGAAGLAFAILTDRVRAGNPGWDENQIFGSTLVWLLPAFLAALLAALPILARGGKPDRPS